MLSHAVESLELDDFSRESLDIEVDFSLPAERVVRILEQIAMVRSYHIRVDNVLPSNQVCF